MKTSIQLICLDFDGTFMVYDEPPGFMHPAVIDEINELGDGGVAWCANSGRDMGSQLEVLSLSRAKGLRHMPVGLLACESLIFRREDGLYVAHEPWNARARMQLRAFHQKLQDLLKPDLPELLERFKPQQLYVHEEATAFLIPSEEEAPARFFDVLAGYAEQVPGGTMSRNGGWVSALPAELGKGALLREFSRATGYDRKGILAVGDHMNDMPMLDGAVARYVGCPGDALPAVTATVRAAGGFVAPSDGPIGTVEVIKHYVPSAVR